MLKSEIVNDKLFQELKPFADSLNLSLVDVQKHVSSADDVHIALVVSSNSGDTTIDDCEHFHRTVQPRLEILFGREALSMEVSTPGLQRQFRDTWEFEVFKSKRCRVYDTSRSNWIEGNIAGITGDAVTLDDYLIEDTAETGTSIDIQLGNVQKAKLEFKFSNKNGDK